MNKSDNIAIQRQIDDISADFEAQWSAGLRPEFKTFLNRIPDSHRANLLEQLLKIDVELRLKAGHKFDAEEYGELGDAATNVVRQQLDSICFIAAAALLQLDPAPEIVNERPRSEAPAGFSTTGPPLPSDLKASKSTTIGVYKLVQRIGEGGMGTVWLAEQEKPVRRRVALKVIRGDIGSPEAVARFEAERQALAMMDHENIATVLDAGTTETGNPYFVMELVDGVPCTQYCNQHRLGIRECLDLFVSVCNAVQHAHQKGIIHRDLKPSNVLVTVRGGKAVAKVIDFGLAKALDQTEKLTDKTLNTEFGRVMGTLKYMSPEQVIGSLDIDTRTDIYALGAMLYELLTGTTPLDRETRDIRSRLRIQAVIQEHDPLRPSIRVAQTADATPGISERRATTLAKLQKILRGELDWIVMKALEKEPSRRYQSAGAFSDDVQRFLNDEVVLARPTSLLYRIQKGVQRIRRNPAAASLTAAIGVAIVLLIASGIFLRYFSINRDRVALANRLITNLEVAEPGEIGNVIGEMKSVPSLVESPLREMLTSGESERRMRAAMALLPFDPSVSPQLVREYFTCDPEYVGPIRELLASVDSLGPVLELSTAVRDDVYRNMETSVSIKDKESQVRLRSACALARVDPAADEWNVIGRDTVNLLMDQSSFTIATIWSPLLRPARDKLVQPLLEAYRTRVGSRDSIGQIVASYYQDDPENLVEFAAVFEPREFQFISAIIEDHRPPVVEIIKQRLAVKAFAPPPAPDVPRECLKVILDAGGMLTGEFAFCQMMELSQFRSVTDQLKPFGFRPTRIRPYHRDDSCLVAAIWYRDNREFLYKFDLSNEEVDTEGKAKFRDGFVAEDLAAYSAVIQENQEVKYVATWVKRAEPGQVRFFVPRLPAEPGEFLNAIFVAQKLKPIRVHALTLADQTVLHSWIIERYDEKTNLNLNLGFLDNYRSSIEKTIFSPMNHIDITSFVDASDENRFISVVQEDATLAERLVFELDPVGMTEIAVSLWNEGFHPTGINTRTGANADEVLSTVVWAKALPEPDASIDDSRQRANLLAVRCQLGDVEPAIQALDYSKETTLRSYLISRLEPTQLAFVDLCSRITTEPDPGRLQGLLIVLGNYATDAGNVDKLEERILNWLLENYRNHDHSGVHSALAWTLRQWEGREFVEQLDSEIASSKGAKPGTRGWYVNSEGQTMIVVPKVDSFLMGAFANEPRFVQKIERIHRRSIDRPFAISSTEVTRFQFMRFEEFKDHKYDEDWSHDKDCPAGRVTWWEAARYCNLLSEQDGISKDQWCYPEDMSDGMTPFPDYLERHGYRLPTEAEWEYAARSGTISTFAHGQQADLLGQYGWHLTDSRSPIIGHPVGSLRPNLFGLFDTHGNAYEWCGNSGENYKVNWETPTADEPDTQPMKRDSLRALRGGSAGNQYFGLRTGSRNKGPANVAASATCFRVARTMD